MSQSKAGTDTLFASQNSSTVQHSSSGRAWRHPESSGWEEGSNSTQGHLSRTSSIATTRLGMPNPALLVFFSKAYRKSHACTPRLSPLISWLFCPLLCLFFFFFKSKSQRVSVQGAGPCFSSSRASAAFALPCLDASAKVKYNPPTHPKQMLETCLSLPSAVL